MRGKFARIVAVAVAGSVLALGGATMAVADGKGTSSTQAAGEQLLQMRTQLVDSAYSADVVGTQRALGQVSPLLGDLAAGQQYQIQSDARQTAASARDDATNASRIIADPAQAATIKQVPSTSPLQSPPPPLDIVADLLRTLIEKLTELLNALTGTPPPALQVPAV
ncbi:hypothetical protein GCM10027445_54840 [Amycolatopsis endophytica]|uniref:Uncharacterized protein n=1 Tax=Amycolatopsis endophytica TaxID=860233 RepID=A0A853B259_9PSEU|nr:hypothetical protein [Amycolatopsis endophytica]NYI88942.1 hypothetical protein [Amycolatopsis endophytica]